jgi:hypothetical protein
MGFSSLAVAFHLLENMGLFFGTNSKEKGDNNVQRELLSVIK